MSLITVVMPMYNARDFVVSAIRTVLRQSIADFELWVIDDGSTDDSIRQVESLRDPRLRLIRQKRTGLGATLQGAINRCDTKFLARMDADDLCGSERFRLQCELLSKQAEIAAVGTQFSYFVGDLVSLKSPRMPVKPGLVRRELLKGSLGVVHASMMFRTDALKKIGGYRISGSGEDWDMFLRLSELGGITNLPDNLYSWRLHPGNVRYQKILVEQLGINYALHCAGCRQRGRPEPTYREYAEKENKLFIKRWGRACQSRSLLHYREGICKVSQKETVSGYAHLAIASALAPDRLIRRIGRELRFRSVSPIEGGINANS